MIPIRFHMTNCQFATNMLFVFEIAVNKALRVVAICCFFSLCAKHCSILEQVCSVD